MKYVKLLLFVTIEKGEALLGGGPGPGAPEPRPAP